MGLRFDIVISGYILFFLSVPLILADIVNKGKVTLARWMFYPIFILFVLCFLICSADIPYFNQFFSRFSIGAFEWIDNPDFILAMVFTEPRYILTSIPFISLSIIFFKGLKRVFGDFQRSEAKTKTHWKATFSLLLLALMFVGIRGRIEKKSPIRIGTAYFCHNPFLNKLGLNPVFTFIRSCLNSADKDNDKIRLIDEKQALINVQNYFNISPVGEKNSIIRHNSPEAPSSKEKSPNVILVIMESMSAEKMTRHGNKKNLTPFLDSISHESYYFENVYTSGKHTFNGIFSTLFSFPALFRKHPMKEIKKYSGLSYALKQNGYSTNYFTTHDGQFDNVEGFLRANDFDNIYTEQGYPSEEVKTTLGVPDDYMFRFAEPILDDLSQDSKPFFVTLMTASDHGPYHVPEYFEAKNESIKDQIVEYADWSIRKFVEQSRKKAWFDNSIFVFVADHGAPLSSTYRISLAYHHTPLIFYAPKVLEDSKTLDMLGSQLDIYPTLMGMLKLPYTNNTLGLDLFQQERPYVIINDDDKYGVLDKEYLMISDDSLKLYKYKNQDVNDYSKKYKKKAIEMDVFAKSNLQLYQKMLDNDELSVVSL